jgi:hypothetical protein
MNHLAYYTGGAATTAGGAGCAARYQSSSRQKQYNCAVVIPCKTHEGKHINPAHMTISFLGAIDEKLLPEVIRDLETTVARPLKLCFGEKDFLGTRKDVEVRLCEIVNGEPDDKKVVTEFAQKWNGSQHDTGMFHVTKKHMGAELDGMTEVVCTNWYLKPLGPYPPVWTKSFTH